jgi:hypothetical protein
MRPGILQLDPGLVLDTVAPLSGRGGPNSLTLAYTGTAIAREELTAQAPALFAGWDQVEIVRLAV